MCGDEKVRGIVHSAQPLLRRIKAKVEEKSGKGKIKSLHPKEYSFPPPNFITATASNLSSSTVIVDEEEKKEKEEKEKRKRRKEEKKKRDWKVVNFFFLPSLWWCQIL